MAYGKTIELFLVNGTPDSLITAEISNWNGKAIKIPRNEVQDCERNDIRGAGVYFLFCEDDNGNESVYIGEAENVQERLIQHLRDHKTGKEEYYWNTAVIFVGRDLNKAHIRYLENRLVETIRECGCYTVLTKSTYRNTVLKESQIAALEEFVDNIKILINTLGYRVFVPIPDVNSETTLLYCKGNKGQAIGMISNGGIAVLRGSVVTEGTAPSFETRGKAYFNLRKRLEANGVIKDRVFTVDYEFSSPSAASSVVLGRCSNGNVEWKTADGKMLRDL